MTSNVKSREALRGMFRAEVRQVSAVWWWFLVLGIVWTGLGMYVLSYRVGSLATVAALVGGVFLFGGVAQLVVASRIQSFMMHLDANLPEPVRESVGQTFRELLTNAVEWGGKLDPTRKVRIACLRAHRMLLYRIADPGEGFDIENLTHAAISNPDDDPIQHFQAREAKGLRPGGFGIKITQSLVDELIYNEARNEVICIKYLD